MKNWFKLLPLFLIFGCTTELDLSSVGLKRRLVVNALLNDLETFKVYVSNTTASGDSVKPDPLANAVVKVTPGTGPSFTCTFNAGTGLYESSNIPLASNVYQISVSAPGFPDAFVSIRIPAAGGLKKPFWKDSTSMDSFGFPNGTITVPIFDPAAEANYYRITIFYWDDLLAEWFSLNPVTLDAEIQNRSIKTDDGGYVFSDEAFNGTEKNIGFITPYAYAQQSPKFQVVTESLSKDYYLYFKSIRDYFNGGGVFAEPSSIYTNITNGLGIGAGSSIRKDIIL